MENAMSKRAPRRWWAGFAGAGVLTAVALAAPGAATAGPIDDGGPLFGITNAILVDDNANAQFTVMFTCAPDAEVDVVVKLVQGATRHGEVRETALCSGKGLLPLNVQVPALGEAWELGPASVYVDLPGYDKGRTTPHPIDVVTPKLQP